MVKLATALKSDVRRDLEKDLSTAAAVKDQLRALLGDALDGDTLKDTIEGETDLFETINGVAFEIGLCEAQASGIAELKKRLDSRKGRLETRAELLRTLLANALDMLGEKQLRVACGTITHKFVPPKLQVTNEAEIPARFWVTPEPVLSNRDLTEALKAREATIETGMAFLKTEREAGRVDEAAFEAVRKKLFDDNPAIPGAELGNGGMTVQIRFS
jgi:Siphovirus Gp157